MLGVQFLQKQEKESKKRKGYMHTNEVKMNQGLLKKIHRGDTEGGSQVVDDEE